MKRAASVQTHAVGIEEIEDDMAVLADDHFRAVVEVNSLNFDLLSEDEQEGVVASYSGGLNSLTFPIQILVRILPVDIELHVVELEQQLKKEVSPKLLELGRDYLAYIRRLARSRTLLDRRFFVVIPSGDEEPLAQTGWRLLKARKRGASPSQGPDSARTQLAFRSDEIERQLNRCGLNARRLSTSDLADLYFTFWCPELAKRQRVRRDLSDYTALVVQASKAHEADTCPS